MMDHGANGARAQIFPSNADAFLLPQSFAVSAQISAHWPSLWAAFMRSAPVKLARACMRSTGHKNFSADAC
jgi:hypothetical protein